MNYYDPLPPETPDEKKKRLRWTCFNHPALILAAVMLMVWHFSQPDYSDAADTAFSVGFALLLIPASFLSWVRDFHDRGLFRLVFFMWIALLFLPNVWAWYAHYEPLFGYEAHWALGIYCVLAIYFFVRVLGRFASLLGSIFDYIFGIGS
jgi:hypothetical protein